MRYTLMRCTPHEVHTHEVHAHEVHAQEVHAHETSVLPLLWWLYGQIVVNLSRSEFQNTSFALVAGGPYCPPHMPRSVKISLNRWMNSLKADPETFGPPTSSTLHSRGRTGV